MSSAESVSLSDGTKMPVFGWGSAYIPPADTAEAVRQALRAGFRSIDTAQCYGNEAEVGEGIRTSGISRYDVYLSTKWSGEPMGDPTMGPAASLRQSLQRMKLSYVDLYIIHTPRLVRDGSMRQRWAEMLALREAGLARNVGISNFQVEYLAELHDAVASMEAERPMPVTAQVWVNPILWRTAKPVVEACQSAGIVVQAVAVLASLRQPDAIQLNDICRGVAARLNIRVEQVLLAWARNKGLVVITSSCKEERLRGYLAVADGQLRAEDISDIETAGFEVSELRRREMQACRT